VGKVLCGECKWLRTDGPCDQWYYYCGLDENKPAYDRVESWHERAGNDRMRYKLDGSCDKGEVDRHNTEQLRAYLDEAGIEWKDTHYIYGDRYSTEFKVGDIRFSISEFDNGSLKLFANCEEEMDVEEVLSIISAIREVQHA
jgi:hypothetical protein